MDFFFGFSQLLARNEPIFIKGEFLFIKGEFLLMNLNSTEGR
jgi:hypothetical protein